MRKEMKHRHTQATQEGKEREKKGDQIKPNLRNERVLNKQQKDMGKRRSSVQYGRGRHVCMYVCPDRTAGLYVLTL